MSKAPVPKVELSAAAFSTALIAWVSTTNFEFKQGIVAIIPFSIALLVWLLQYLAAVLNIKTREQLQARNAAEQTMKDCQNILKNPESSENAIKVAQEELDKAQLALIQSNKVEFGIQNGK